MTCSCVQQKSAGLYKLSVRQKILLPSSPGSSGLVFHQGKVILISDNMPGYQTMDTSNFSHLFYAFKPGALPVAQDKNIKEDFENASIITVLNKPYVVAFGSGSVSSREQALFFQADSLQKNKLVYAGKLYSAIKNLLHIATPQLNVEGSFSTPDSFYLLNRGTNHLIAMNLQTLEDLLTSGNAYPKLNARQCRLPLFDSFPIAFSGACYYRERTFLFTASVEKTSNWIDDGEVAGSWVGMATLDGKIEFLLPLKDDKGNMLPYKLESLDIIRSDENGDITIAAIADNDDGQSTWFRLMLSKN